MLNGPATRRLNGDSYKRPEQTLTDKLTNKQIETMLQDYVKVDDMTHIQLGTHLRYFADIKGEKKFRPGGILYKTGFPKYVILSNGDRTWSVQLKDTKFYRKLTSKEIKDERDEELKKAAKITQDKDKEIAELRKYVKHLQKNNANK